VLEYFHPYLTVCHGGGAGCVGTARNACRFCHVHAHTAGLPIGDAPWYPRWGHPRSNKISHINTVISYIDTVMILHIATIIFR